MCEAGGVFSNAMKKNISILDATLRDGGMGLEDLYKNHLSSLCFTEAAKARIATLLAEAEIDFVEVGGIRPSSHDRTSFAIYRSIEELSETVPCKASNSYHYSALYTGPDTLLSDIPNWNEDLVKHVRVVLRYSELNKSLDFCAGLAAKGYKVFVQPMLTMRYTDKELELVCHCANEMGAFACYFVDSYGYMKTKDIGRIFTYMNDRLESNIKMGFHAHNNMGLAYANAIHFANIDTSRSLIIDSCAMGMGQGAGNVQTELLITYLNEEYDKRYNLDFVLEACEILDEMSAAEPIWGYSLTRMLPAIHKTAYKYAAVLRHKHHVPFVGINKILKEMPHSLRARYTEENMEILLKKFSIA